MMYILALILFRYVGWCPGVNNQITLRLASQMVGQYTVMTNVLPPTDSASVSLGFPIISVSYPAQQASLVDEGLYFPPILIVIIWLLIITVSSGGM
ncbi:arylsulfatase [Salmonella enterica subsp. arizonae]|uniref:Arylsulfatase n=1 Tax=Salmonella enterica subsp. arizonae TaxID=59203 RepID=A0A379THK9_SALER|nr:arylsulfatase [Salmonella enterica subsp. arizonae]